MAAEYFAATPQDVLLNQAATFTASIPCNRGNIFFENGGGVFALNGPRCGGNCFARYQVTFNGNLSVPEGGTAGPIAVALSVNGETRQSSVAVVTPAAVEQPFNATSTAIVTVPRGCCAYVSLRHVAASADPTVTPAPVITIANGNLVISRIA